MLVSTLITLAASLSTASAVYQGFNYGATFTDNSWKQEADFEAEFNTAKALAGTNGAFNSARLYTMIQAGTTNSPTSAIQAAINTQTTLLLGLWASAGDADFANELIALNSAIAQYGRNFTSLIAGISVGSEDLYRITPTGIANKAGVGASPDTIVKYINQAKSAIGCLSPLPPVGHVDTWTAWVNSSNDAVIAACDFIGMDAYPYYQTMMANSIENGNQTFWNAYDATLGAVGSKPVWITETGWPVSGPTENLAVPSVQNAQTYWDQVGCSAAFGKINTWWYTLRDTYPTTPAPSFGVTLKTTTPIYSLSC